MQILFNFLIKVLVQTHSCSIQQQITQKLEDMCLNRMSCYYLLDQEVIQFPKAFKPHQTTQINQIIDQNNYIFLIKNKIFSKNIDESLDECRRVQTNVDESLDECRRMQTSHQTSVDKCRRVQTSHQMSVVECRRVIDECRRVTRQVQTNVDKRRRMQTSVDESLDKCRRMCKCRQVTR